MFHVYTIGCEHQIHQIVEALRFQSLLTNDSYKPTKIDFFLLLHSED